MKRILLSGFLAIFSFSLIAQNNNFKPVTKKQNGSVPKAAVNKFLNGSVSQKGMHKSYSMPVSFQRPVTPAKRDDIRKIITRKNLPVFIEKTVSAEKSSIPSSPEERFYDFFVEMKPVTNISNPEEALSISGIHSDELGITHVDAVQLYRGVRIYGSESSLHITSSNEIFTGRLYNIDREISTEPLFSPDQILAAVTRDLKKRTAWKEMSEKEREISKYESPAFSICILPQDDNTFTLAYEIEIRPNFLERWRYFVDARTGRILSKYNITCSDGPATANATDLNGNTRLLDTYLQSGNYLLVDAAEHMYNSSTQDGVVMTLNANYTSATNLDYKYISSATNSWSIPASVSAHYNAATTYKYFYNTFGRNSLNGQGGDIISLINVTEENGSSMENAFWNGYAVFYGNGGTNFKPLAGAMDVTAHELGHGVVSNTANLEYNGQSGAMNETYADIFGAMVDRNDWLIGEDITKTGFSPSGALRNMADPHNMGTSLADPYWQPKHVSEMYLGTNDNGGVHLNSGIGNYAFYLFATALASKEKAEQVFYRALTNYLKSTSQFIDFRIAVVQSAKDLYGATSTEASEAAKAFDAVGIHEEEQVNTEQNYSTNPGLAYLLSYDTNTSDPNSLYRSTTSGTDYAALTTTAMKGKVSVTDAGNVAVFVSTTGYIKALNTNPLSPQEKNISPDAVWDNVAVSKDGNRIAAISTYIDTAIYVFDLVSGTGVKYHLYNPTTSETNVDAGGVLYADAIEFDITGEYLIYDSYNVLYSTTTDPIYYWDIGFINVWDNTLDDYGTGEISKLFGSLPENVSIGNPVFSKNSPYIIAFDYFDTYNDEYAILGTNLQTGDLDVIVSNTILGYPSYSKEDNKIAYSSLNTSDENVVAVVGLNANKISASGSASILVPDAKWPVFYSTGLRVLGLKPVSNFTVDIKEGNAPLRVQFLDLSINDPTSWSWSFAGGTPSTSTTKNPVVTFNNSGTYNVTLTASNDFGSDANTKNAYITVNIGTGINDINTGDIRFYPNPATDFLNISSNMEFVVRILNLQGALVLQRENQDKIDISDLAKGLYIIEIITDKETIRRKLIKK